MKRGTLPALNLRSVPKSAADWIQVIQKGLSFSWKIEKERKSGYYQAFIIHQALKDSFIKVEKIGSSGHNYLTVLIFICVFPDVYTCWEEMTFHK